MAQYKYTYEGKDYMSEWALRRAMPYVSLPKVLTDEILERYGIVKSEIPTPTTDVATARRTALNRLEQTFNAYSESKDSYITSSLGFKANCRYRAFMDVSGLVLQAKNADELAKQAYELAKQAYEQAKTEAQAQAEGEAKTEAEAPTPPEPQTVTFMDFDDTPHNLTAEQLETLALEISQNGTRAYGVKWAYRTALESAETVEEITEIAIGGFDFRPDDQKPKARTLAQKARSTKKSTSKTTTSAA